MTRPLRRAGRTTIDWFGPTRVALVHHLVAAVMMAMLTLVLDHAHVLDWLDAGMLRLVGARNGHFETRSDPFAALRPAVVDIDRRAYTDLFDERSPLARPRLARILEHLDVPTVRVVAIDIDLSPVRSDRSAAGPDVLDATIDRLARHGKSVVLVLPDASEEDDKLGWIRERCAVPGISFATPSIRERFGAVTLVETKVATLSAVAFARSTPRAGSEELSRRVCELAARSRTDRALVDAAGEAVEEDGELPLHPDAVAFRYAFQATTGVIDRGGDIGLEDEGVLRPVVFLGGDYEQADRFRTADGTTAGLLVHAGMFTSLGTPTHRLATLPGFLFDVASAVVLGFLFAGVWNAYGRLEARGLARGRDLMPLSSRSARAAVAILGVRVAIVVVWAIPVVLTLLVFLGAQHLLLQGVWLNPGTLVIGMFLDSRSARREGVDGAEGAIHERPHDASTGRRPSWLRHLAIDHPDTVVTQPLIILVLGCVLAFQLASH